MTPATLAAGGVLAISVAMAAVWLKRVLSNAAVTYRARFTAEAKASLKDLFLFIDPERLFRLNVSAIVVAGLAAWAWTGGLIWPLVLVSILALLPRLIYRRLHRRRRERFVAQLPDALLAISGAMKSGSSVVQAIEVLVAESRGPIAQEFGLFLREVRVGVGYDEALTNLSQRMPGEDLALVVSGMRIAREIGGNLADTLERISDTLRRKLVMEGKIKALTAQGRLQGIVMASLPVLLGVVLFQIEPVHMARLFHEPWGWATLAVAAIMESIGYFFIKKIVEIDV